MGTPTDRPSVAFRRLGIIALFAPLFAILVAALWYAAKAWVSVQGPPMPMHGYIAMTLGVGLSLVVGCGLMTLLFYSSRHGYDERSYSEPSYRDLGPTAENDRD